MKKTITALSLVPIVVGCSAQTPPPSEASEAQGVRFVESLREGEIGQPVEVRPVLTTDVADVTVNHLQLTDTCVYGDIWTEKPTDFTGEDEQFLTVDMTILIEPGPNFTLDQTYVEYGEYIDRAYEAFQCDVPKHYGNVLDPVDPQNPSVIGSYIVHEDITAFVVGGHRFEVSNVR